MTAAPETAPEAPATYTVTLPIRESSIVRERVISSTPVSWRERTTKSYASRGPQADSVPSFARHRKRSESSDSASRPTAAAAFEHVTRVSVVTSSLMSVAAALACWRAGTLELRSA